MLKKKDGIVTSEQIDVKFKEDNGLRASTSHQQPNVAECRKMPKQ